jgi:hypothetical protein
VAADGTQLAHWQSEGISTLQRPHACMRTRADDHCRTAEAIMSPLRILVATIVILTLDYVIEVSFRRRASRDPYRFLRKSCNPLLRNTLRVSGH